MSKRVNTRQIRDRNQRILATTDICHLCGEPGADAIDHVIPVARGGTNHPANLRPAHHNTPNSASIRCNLAKKDKLPDLTATTSRAW